MKMLEKIRSERDTNLLTDFGVLKFKSFNDGCN